MINQDRIDTTYEIPPHLIEMISRSRSYSVGFSVMDSSTQQQETVMANEAVKLKFLHKKIVDRYLENPTSDDEDIIKVMDLGNTNQQTAYTELGYSTHPIYLREHWVSEVAANVTNNGYWMWVGEKVRGDKTYVMGPSGIHERTPQGNEWLLPPAPAPAPFPLAEAIVPGVPEVQPAPPRPRARPSRAEEERRAMEDVLSGMRPTEYHTDIQL